MRYINQIFYHLTTLIVISLICGCDGCGPKNAKQDLLQALAAQDFEAAKKAINRSPDLINEYVDANFTVLHTAVHYKNVPFVLFLLEKGANVNVTMNNDKETPLHLAASMGQDEIASALIDYGADINAKNVYAKTPLHLACQYSDEKMVNLLISHGANIEAVTDRGETPLCTACIRPQETETVLSIMRLLLNNGADANVIWADDPLIYMAVAMQHFRKATLLEDRGAILRLKTTEGLREYTVEEARVLYLQLENIRER